MIESGVAVSVVSAQVGVSKSGLYRHSNNHGSTVSDEIESVTYAGTPTAMLARLDEISNDLRTVRRAAVAAGNAMAATRAADAETRSLVAMADRLGVEDTDLAASLAQLTAIARSVAQAARRDPRVGEVLCFVLDDNGHPDIAAELRAAFPSNAQGEIQ
jgi:hypothetical protein